MLKKIAIKRLTASDLTFFEWQFKNRNAGNQKAINLNADVFINKLFPLLPEVTESRNGRIPVDLSIYGPGFRGLHNLQRKIVKFGTYKNWRLNGEFVYNPDTDPERYNSLEAEDLVVFEFDGIEEPHSMIAIFISKYEDSILYKVLKEQMGTMKMLTLTNEDLENSIKSIGLDESHPINVLMIGEDLEEYAISGGNLSFEKLNKPSLKSLSQDDLIKAKRNAESNGKKGEEFIYYLLVKKRSSKSINSFVWESYENAISPYDFSVDDDVLLDVKSTGGDFSRKIHVSINELKQAVQSEKRYDIYRVYEMKENIAKLRIFENLKPVADLLLASFSELPKGIGVEGVTIDPNILSFGVELNINITSIEE